MNVVAITIGCLVGLIGIMAWKIGELNDRLYVVESKLDISHDTDEAGPG